MSKRNLARANRRRTQTSFAPQQEGGVVVLCSFTGGLANLKKSERTTENALTVLAKDPRVSVFDMCEHAWLRGLIDDLTQRGLIKSEDEPFPWLRYSMVKVDGGDDD